MSNDSHDGGEETELEKWESIHALLKRSVLKAQAAVAVQQAQKRYWLEQLAANLNDAGKVETTTSTWKKMNMKLPKAMKSAAGGSPAKKKRKAKDAEAGGAASSSPAAERNVSSAKKPKKKPRTAPTGNNNGDDLTLLSKKPAATPSTGRTRINIRLPTVGKAAVESESPGGPAPGATHEPHEDDESDGDDSSPPDSAQEESELDRTTGALSTGGRHSSTPDHPAEYRYHTGGAVRYSPPQTPDDSAWDPSAVPRAIQSSPNKQMKVRTFAVL
jgi:hypothetical protein